MTMTLIKHTLICSSVSSQPFYLVYASLLFRTENKMLHLKRQWLQLDLVGTAERAGWIPCVSLTLPFVHKLREKQSKIIVGLSLPESQRAPFLPYPLLYISFRDAADIIPFFWLHTLLFEFNEVFPSHMTIMLTLFIQRLGLFSIPHERGEYWDCL